MLQGQTGRRASAESKCAAQLQFSEEREGFVQYDPCKTGFSVW